MVGKRTGSWQAYSPLLLHSVVLSKLSAPSATRGPRTWPDTLFTKATGQATLSNLAVEPEGEGMASTSSRRPVDGLGFFAIAGYGAQVEDSATVTAVRVAAYARRNVHQRRFAVVNDYVASTLGMAVGLPVPPGALLRFHQGEPGYLSLGFSDRGDRPPPIIPPVFTRERPWEATGIIAFDQWILNNDRHDANLAYLPNSGVAVFDHDMALICNPQDGDACTSLESGLEQTIKGHLLSRHLETAEYFSEWFDRVKSVRKREIRRAVTTCFDANLIDDKIRDKLIGFLEHRQTRIHSHIGRTVSEYVKIDSWPLDIGGVTNEG